MTGPRPDDELRDYLPTVIVGELEHAPVVIAEYDPAWVERFGAEAGQIRAALGAAALRIEHIGSTSVPGLPAKPIVDILLVVADSSDEPSYLPTLEAAGYALRVREPGFHEHRMLRSPARDVHVHVFSPGSPEIERYVLLRDRLREDAAERALYERTKRRLAAQDWPTVDHYAAAKTAVIEGIIARARAARDAG